MGLFDKFKSPKKPLKGDKKKKKKVVKAGKKPAKNPKPKKNKKGKLTIDDLNVNPVLEDNLYKIMDTAMDDPDEPYVAKADMDGEYYVYGLALNDKLIKENGFDQGQPTILSQIKTGLDIGGKHGADADGALVNASFDHDLHSNTDHQIVFMPTVKTLQNLESIGGSDAKYQVTIIPADISSENFDEYFEQGLINANLSEDDGTPMELTIDGFKDLTESLDNDPAFKKNEGVEDDLGDDDLDNDGDDDLGDFDPDTSMPDDGFSPDDNDFDDSSSTNPDDDDFDDSYGDNSLPDDDFGDNSLPDDDFNNTSLTNPDDNFDNNSSPDDDFDNTSLVNPDDDLNGNSLSDDDLNGNSLTNLNDDLNSNSSTNPDDDFDDTSLVNPDDDFDDTPLVNPDDDLNGNSSTNLNDDLNSNSSTNPDTSNVDDMLPVDSDDDLNNLFDNDDDLGNTNPSELDENNGEDDDDAPVFDEDDKSEEPEDNGNSNDEPSGESNIDEFLNNGDSSDEPGTNGDSNDEPVADGNLSDNSDSNDSNDEPETNDDDSNDEPETNDDDSNDEPETNDDDSNDEPEEPVEPEKPKTLGEQNLNNFIAHNIIKLDAALDSLDTERFRVDTDSDSSSTVGYKSLYNDLLSSQIKREKEYIRSRYKQEIGQLLDPYVNPASFAGHFVKVNQLLEDKFMSPSEMTKQTEESKASISARYEEIHQDLLEKAQAKAEMEFANRYEPECQRELAEAEKAVTVKHQQEYDEAVQKVLNKLFFDNQASLTSQSQKIITRLIDKDIPNANLALTSQAKAYSEEMVRYAQFEKMIDARSGVSRDKLDQGTAKALERMQKEIDEAKKAQKAKDKQIASLETQLNESKAVKKTEPVKTNDENQKDLEVLKHASVEVKQDDVINDLINRFAPEDKPEAETEKQTEDEKTPEK